LALTLASMDEMGSVGKIEVMQGRESTWAPLADVVPAAGGLLKPPMRTLQIVGGRKEKIRAGDVMGALAGECGLTREQVGKINVNEFSTYVAVQADLAKKVEAQLSHGKIKGKSVKVRLLIPSSLAQTVRRSEAIHLPSCRLRCASGRRREVANISIKVCSETGMDVAPAVMATVTPPR
jgi:hypothetical protein